MNFSLACIFRISIWIVQVNFLISSDSSYIYNLLLYFFVPQSLSYEWSALRQHGYDKFDNKSNELAT